jgi:protein TonB
MKHFYTPFLPVFLLFSFAAFSQEEVKHVPGDCLHIVEIEAEPPGGMVIWNKYLRRALNADIGRQNGAPAGAYTINIRFLITRNGSIDSVMAISDYGYGMEQEAIRVIQQAPKWCPAQKHGRYQPQWAQHFIIFTVPAGPPISRP